MNGEMRTTQVYDELFIHINGDIKYYNDIKFRKIPLYTVYTISRRKQKMKFL